MRIVIVGDGKIGSALAEQLSREGHEITIVDRSGAPLQRTAVQWHRLLAAPHHGRTQLPRTSGENHPEVALRSAACESSDV